MELLERLVPHNVQLRVLLFKLAETVSAVCASTPRGSSTR